jgi:hypothetical protein
LASIPVAYLAFCKTSETLLRGSEGDENEALPTPAAMVDWSTLPEAALGAETRATLEEAISTLSNPLASDTGVR